ncbi:MAG: LysE family transporter [Candidatus Omnitrophica bacterium]|nr:LysE family transporter [Candidatus Omnitrophota bacterium]
MVDLAILFGVGVGTGLSGAMIPGPLFLYVVSEAFRHGVMAGIRITVGHLLLEALLAALILVGLRTWLDLVAFRTAVAWVGGVSLAAMGWLLLRRLPHLSLSEQAHVDFGAGHLAGGVFFSVISPGFLLWWATIGAAVLLQGALRGAAGIAMVLAGHALADLLWHGVVAASVERGRTYCTDQFYRRLMAALAVALIVLGLGLVVRSTAG